MSELEQALRKSRELIEAALADARQELAALDARKAELEALIVQGESALGGAPAPVVQDSGATLQEALQRILRENGNRPLHVRQLADEVNQRGLYRRRDTGPVEVSQVHARTSTYDKVFGKGGSFVWLKEEPGVIVPFKDDDSRFLAWITNNPDGYRTEPQAELPRLAPQRLPPLQRGLAQLDEGLHQVLLAGHRRTQRLGGQLSGRPGVQMPVMPSLTETGRTPSLADPVADHMTASRALRGVDRLPRRAVPTQLRSAGKYPGGPASETYSHPAPTRASR